MKLLQFLILGVFLPQLSHCLPQTQDPLAHLPIICQVSVSDWVIDPLVARHLATLYCNGLLAHPPPDVDFNGHSTGPNSNYTASFYPTDLAPLPGGYDLSELTREGYAFAGEFFRWNASDICGTDNCVAIFDKIIGTCERDSHYVGGTDAAITNCGLYQFYIQNCLNNREDPFCDRWHLENPTLGVPPAARSDVKGELASWMELESPRQE